MQLPQIVLVTPVYNGQQFLRATIESVLAQDYSNLQYCIVDGGSTDDTLKIIKEYDQHLHYWSSEPDESMYHAINKGFSHSNGEVMGWLNSDDLLLPNALNSVGEVFAYQNEATWLTGLSTTIDASGNIVRVKMQHRITDCDFLLGPVIGLQQESTFFRRSLWDNAGGSMNLAFKYAADYELWCRFLQLSTLKHIHRPIGAFRRHGTQITTNRHHEYHQEIAAIRHLYKNQLTISQRIKGLIRIRLHSFFNRFAPFSDYSYDLTRVRKLKP